MIPMMPMPTAPTAGSPPTSSQVREPADGFDAVLSSAMGPRRDTAPDATSSHESVRCADCEAGGDGPDPTAVEAGQVVTSETTVEGTTTSVEADEMAGDLMATVVLAPEAEATEEASESTEMSPVMGTPVGPPTLPPVTVSASGTGAVESCVDCGTAVEQNQPALPTVVAPAPALAVEAVVPPEVTPDVAGTAVQAPATPASAVLAEAVDAAVATSARFVERVERVVAQLELAGPPKMMVVDLAEFNGLRITVSLRGSGVHLAFASAVPDDVSSWMTDLQRSLQQRGLQLSGDAPGQGDETPQERADRDRREHTPSGSQVWTWPPSVTVQGENHGSDRSN